MGFLDRRPKPVGPAHVAGVLELCGRDPVMGLSLAQQVLRWNSWGRGDVVVLGRSSAPRAAAWATSSLMPLGLTADPGTGLPGVGPGEARALAEHARARVTRQGSVLGPQSDVEAVWTHLRASGLRAREERWNQPMLLAPEPQVVREHLEALLAARPTLRWVSHGLRPAQPGELDLVLPASVQMFISEVGYDPTASGGSYARHVGELVGQGRSYVLLDDGDGCPVAPGSPQAQVAFKADLGCLWQWPGSLSNHGVAQLTGVWTRPDLRGRGIGAVALARVVERVRAEHVGAQGQVSLYVNDFNTPALGLYRSLGFTRHGTFATILL